MPAADSGALILGSLLVLSSCRADDTTLRAPVRADPSAAKATPARPQASPCPDGAAVASPQYSSVAGELEPDPALVRRACLHCRVEIDPDDRHTVELPFRAGEVTLTETAELAAEESRFVTRLAARPELALRIVGDRGPREPEALAPRRAAVVRARLVARGVRETQLVLADIDPRTAMEPRVLLELSRSEPGPIAAGEPCGTQVVVAAEGQELAAVLATRGLWLRPDEVFHAGRSEPAPSSGPGAPLRGSRLAALTHIADGFTELRRVAPQQDDWLLTFGLDGASRRRQRMPSGPQLGHGLALSATPRGLVLAWPSADGGICTTIVDELGERLRAARCAEITGHAIRELAMDIRDGVGAIVFPVETSTGFYGHTGILPIDDAGEFRGPANILALSSLAMGPVAVAVLGPESIAVLSGGCGGLVARIDVDPRGEVVAFDKQFLRGPHHLGIAVARGPSGPLAISLTRTRADIRPLCPLGRR